MCRRCIPSAHGVNMTQSFIYLARGLLTGDDLIMADSPARLLDRTIPGFSTMDDLDQMLSLRDLAISAATISQQGFNASRRRPLSVAETRRVNTSKAVTPSSVDWRGPSPLVVVAPLTGGWLRPRGSMVVEIPYHSPAAFLQSCFRLRHLTTFEMWQPA